MNWSTVRANMMTFSDTSSTTTSTIANWICLTLGFCAISLNVFVLAILLSNRKRFLKHVFYFLVFHCSVVEIIQSSALIVWCLPATNIFSLQAYFRLMILKQWVVIFLRSMNIMTLLNLLLFTLNEFVLVKKPLLYRRVTRRRFVAVFIVLNWVLSCTIGLIHVLGKKFRSPSYRVYVLQNFTLTNTTDPFSLKRKHDTSADETDKSPIMLASVVICGICLTAVITCYSVVMKRIRDVRKNRSNPRPAPVDLKPNHIYLRQVSCEPASPTRYQLVLKHKYIIVIITILFVYSLFIIPYSLIQGLQYINVSSLRLKDAHRWTEPLWILQVFIGLHSVLQPLCYFRMKEFRRAAVCGLCGQQKYSVSVRT